MIIILEPQKDSYVTNLKTKNNDASLANTGNAATLDLFKLYNENENAYSWTLLEFIGALDDDSEFKLTDVDGNVVTFIIKTDVNTFDGSVNEDNKVVIGVLDTNGNDNQAERFAAVINNVTTFDNSLTLNIDAYNNLENQLVLKQKKSGENGDTLIELPPNMSCKTPENKFSRIDYSNLLIKFDLESFKNKWNIGNELPGAFENLSAELILKDVTTGISKPKEYELELYKLNKNFIEGTGKDTIYFSDSDKCNFYSLSNNDDWEISEFVSNSDAESIGSKISSIDLSVGNEDLVFNITNYIQEEIIKDDISDMGFLVKFSDDYIFNNLSYFVKRLGSRHLINKQFIPQLRVKINDSSYNIPTNSFNKLRYLNSDEDFYLFKNSNGQLQSIDAPNGFSLKLKISSFDRSQTFVTKDANLTVENFLGEVLLGVKKVSLDSTDLSRYAEEIIPFVKNNALSTIITWFWEDDTNEENVLSVFEEKANFLVSESSNDTKYENLITAIKITENDLVASDNICAIEVYFVDTKKEFNSVKVPYELPSENIGEVKYQLYDVETENIMLDYEEATNMFYDGEKYKFNLFLPRQFKNKRINFKFKYKDILTGTERFIFNKKYSVRVL
tara:strand:- start:100 stop:1950 length:1851 start_codon:yes stop_codon:yes gene_type:complete